MWVLQLQFVYLICAVVAVGYKIFMMIARVLSYHSGVYGVPLERSRKNDRIYLSQSDTFGLW